MKIILVIFCFLFLFTSSCKKDGLSANATIMNSGDPAADGCGWLVKITGSDSTYSPTNLPEIYKTDNLKVHINYKRLSTTYHCGFSGHITQIKIDAIEKSN